MIDHRITIQVDHWRIVNHRCERESFQPCTVFKVTKEDSKWRDIIWLRMIRISYHPKSIYSTFLYGLDHPTIFLVFKYTIEQFIWKGDWSILCFWKFRALNPIRLGGSKSTHSAWGVNLTPPLKSRRWGQKSLRLGLHIDIWSIKDFSSHPRPRYDKKWKIHQSKSEKSRFLPFFGVSFWLWTSVKVRKKYLWPPDLAENCLLYFL